MSELDRIVWRTVEHLRLLEPQPTRTYEGDGPPRPGRLMPVLGAAFPHHPYGYEDLELGPAFFGFFEATHHAVVRDAIDRSFGQVLHLDVETPTEDDVRIRLGAPVVGGDRWWVFIERRTPTKDRSRWAYTSEWFGAFLNDSGYVGARAFGSIAPWTPDAWARRA